MTPLASKFALPGLAFALLLTTCVDVAHAGLPRVRRSRLVPTTRSMATYPARAPGLAPSPMLGNFNPTPVMNVRGNYEQGGGYTPIGDAPEFTLSLYGPLSALRQVTAPVVVYERGYDGYLRPTVGQSFSNPNRPELNPVVYPTRANVYYAPRSRSSSPAYDDASTWIDQN